nr:hypothetical protein [uncultured Desulfobacter sp.]
MESSDQIKIIQYSKEYKERLLSFMSFLWKNAADEEKRKKFEWRYELNPAQMEDYMFLALNNGQIVGFRSFVVQDFILDQKIIKVLVGADGIVHPDFRKLGLLKRFNLKSIEVFSFQFERVQGIILILSANKIPTIANQKQGWQRTTGLKKYAYKISLLNIFKTVFFKIDQQTRHKRIKHRNLEIEVLTELKEDLLAAYFIKNRFKDKIVNYRTAKFYRWRYLEDRNLDRSYIYAYKNGELAGFLIIERISAKQSLLLEYGADSAMVLSKMLNTASRYLNICVLRTLYTSKNQETLMKRSGCFIETDTFLKLIRKERLPVLVRPNIVKPEDKDFVYDGLDIRDIENWILYSADGY